MNRNAVIQRFAASMTGASPTSVARLGGIGNLNQYARAWLSHDDASGKSGRLFGSADRTKFLVLPNYYDTLYTGFGDESVGNLGTLTNIDIRGQAEIAYGQDAFSAPTVTNLTLCLLREPGSKRARSRIVSAQTIIPEIVTQVVFDPGPPIVYDFTYFTAHSQIVDCFDVDTLSIQVTEASAVSTTWYIQGSIDGEWWYDVPSVGQTTTSNAALGKQVSSGTFVRNLDVSGYRYVRLSLTAPVAVRSQNPSPFNTLATFYGEALE